MSAASPISEQLALVHAGVAGRTRFQVAGLYRSNRFKQRLETALSDVDGVHRVNASSLTGRVLVLYDPDITMDDIVAAIEQLLDTSIRLHRKPARSPAPEGLNDNDSLNIKQAFDKASGLIGSIPALLYSLPIFNRPAPAQTPLNENTEAQSIDAWHLKDLDEVLQLLGTLPRSGLDDKEASQRLQRYGKNSQYKFAFAYY